MNNSQSTILAEQLRKIRLAAGFTQQNIADALKINRATYTYYETGKTLPDIVTIQKLAVLYQIDIQDLLSGDINNAGLRQRPKKKISQKPEHIDELSSQEKSLIALLRLFGQKELQVLIDHYKAQE